MKKLLLICIVIVGIVFVAGCIGGEKASPETKTSTKSQSIEYLIDPTNLVNGYYASDYTTYATSKLNSFEGEFTDMGYGGVYPVSGQLNREPYEGNLPNGKKRIYTSFTLKNDDNSIQIGIGILESDSDLKFKESFSNSFSNLTNKLKYIPNVNIENNIIGDYSFLYTFKSSEGENNWVTMIHFSYGNYGINLRTICNSLDGKNCKSEGLKVSNAIISMLE